MRAQLTNALLLAVIGTASIPVAGCGDFVRQDRAPVTLVINTLEGARGSDPGNFFGGLTSDVALDNGGRFNDLGRVTLQMILKDPGIPGAPNTPSATNQVTITRYHVAYRRADGRNTQGVDVPFAFDGVVTFTVPAAGTVTSGFELVRIQAKLERPLSDLEFNRVFLSAFADVTFFGHDQAGNAVSVSGSILVSFGNFGDVVGG